MADPIVPIVPSLTYGEAIGRSIPVIQQQQQLRQQRDRFNQQQLQRLETEKRQREQREYQRNKDLQKQYNDQRESLSDLKNKGKYNDGELAAINFILEEYSQAPDNADLFNKIITEAEQYTTVFDSFHEAIDDRQSEYESYTFGNKELGNGLKWNGTIETLNNENRLVYNGGFDYTQLSRDEETNEIVAPYYDAKLGEDGKPQYLKDENGQVIKGPILKSPYYQLDANNMFSIQANTGTLAERNANTYLQEDLSGVVKSYNENKDLSPEEKRQGLKDDLTRSFNTYETLNENGKEAYHTALKEYKLENYPNNPGHQLTDDQKASAISQYIDRVVSLYQPKVFDADKEIAYLDFFKKELQSSWNRINAQDVSKSEKEQMWSNFLDGVLSDDTLFSSNVNYTRLSNTVTTAWEQENAGNSIEESAKKVAIRETMKERLLNISDIEFSTKKSTRTQTEIQKSELRKSSLNSASDIMGWDGDPAVLAQNFSARGFGIKGFEKQSVIPLSGINIPLNLNKYIGDEFKKKKVEGEWTFDPESGEMVKQPDTYENGDIAIKSSPGTMKLLIGDNGLVYIELSDWSSGGVDRKALDEVYIEAAATGTPIWQNLNSALKKAMGIGIPELVNKFDPM